MTAITKRQSEILTVIIDFIEGNGYSPSFTEIAHMCSLSSLATVHKHISNLERKGLLRRDYNHSRSIEVMGQKRKQVRGHQLAKRVYLHLMHTGEKEAANVVMEAQQ